MVQEFFGDRYSFRIFFINISVYFSLTIVDFSLDVSFTQQNSSRCWELGSTAYIFGIGSLKVRSFSYLYDSCNFTNFLSNVRSKITKFVSMFIFDISGSST